MLNFQQEMKQKLGRSNVETVLGVKEIPCNVQITTLLDGIEPKYAGEVFNEPPRSKLRGILSVVWVCAEARSARKFIITSCLIPNLCKRYLI